MKSTIKYKDENGLICYKNKRWVKRCVLYDTRKHEQKSRMNIIVSADSMAQARERAWACIHHDLVKDADLQECHHIRKEKDESHYCFMVK